MEVTIVVGPLHDRIRKNNIRQDKTYMCAGNEMFGRIIYFCKETLLSGNFAQVAYNIYFHNISFIIAITHYLIQLQVWP